MTFYDDDCDDYGLLAEERDDYDDVTLPPPIARRPLSQEWDDYDDLDWSDT